MELEVIIDAPTETSKTLLKGTKVIYRGHIAYVAIKVEDDKGEIHIINPKCVGL